MRKWSIMQSSDIVCQYTREMFDRCDIDEAQDGDTDWCGHLLDLYESPPKGEEVFVLAGLVANAAFYGARPDDVTKIAVDFAQRTKCTSTRNAVCIAKTHIDCISPYDRRILHDHTGPKLSLWKNHEFDGCNTYSRARALSQKESRRLASTAGKRPLHRVIADVVKQNKDTLMWLDDVETDDANGELVKMEHVLRNMAVCGKPGAITCNGDNRLNEVHHIKRGYWRCTSNFCSMHVNAIHQKIERILNWDLSQSAVDDLQCLIDLRRRLQGGVLLKYRAKVRWPLDDTFLTIKARLSDAVFDPRVNWFGKDAISAYTFDIEDDETAWLNLWVFTDAYQPNQNKKQTGRPRLYTPEIVSQGASAIKTFIECSGMGWIKYIPEVNAEQGARKLIGYLKGKERVQMRGSFMKAVNDIKFVQQPCVCGASIVAAKAMDETKYHTVQRVWTYENGDQVSYDSIEPKIRVSSAPLSSYHVPQR